MIIFKAEDTNPSNLSIVHAPDYMGLSSEYIKKHIKFFEQIAEKKESFCIDFSEVKEMYVSTTIMLYSIIEQLKNKNPELKIYFKYKQENKNLVRYMCENTGLDGIAKGEIGSNEKNSYLNIISIDAVPSESEKTHAIHACKMIKSINDKLFQGEMKKEQMGDLFRGISEALMNVTDHAYEKKDDGGLKKCWTAAINLEDWLHIVIYDRGIGIPQSIRRKVEFLKYFTMDDKVKDSDLIAKSVQKNDKNYMNCVGKNSNGGETLNIRELVKNFNMETKLVIISNKGCYNEYNRGGEGISVGQLTELDVPLEGTLIQWSIKIKSS